MTSFSKIDNEDAFIVSVTEDFLASTKVGDEEDDALLASLPEPEELSAKSSDKVGHKSQISRPDHLKNHSIPSVLLNMKQETKDISKLWEYPSGRLAHDDNTELTWKGHLTKFQLTAFKRFQLDAIHALETKKDVFVIQKTGSGKSICFQVPSLFDNTKTTVMICPTISLIHSQVESLTGLGLNAIAVGPQQQTEIGEETEALTSLIYTMPEYFSKKLKDRLSASNLLKVIVIDEAISFPESSFP